TFLFATCQIGAETALKAEVAREWPDFHPAFAAGGFLTFKLPPKTQMALDFDLRSVFARASGVSLGRVDGDDLESRLQAVLRATEKEPFDRIHLWPRDRFRPGYYRYQPGDSPDTIQANQALRELAAAKTNAPRIGGLARPNEHVLDVILLDDEQWWLGRHQAGPSRLPWPGGLDHRELPAHAVSRAYLKMQQALEWSRLPLKSGHCCAELGSSPGGSSQALLDRGMRVIGIDPAEPADVVAEHPNYTHVRKFAAQVRRRVFRDVRWLMGDVSAAPNYALDAAQAVVEHRETSVQGLLMTLKLPDWKLAEQVPEYLARVRSWGFTEIRARQLQYNRQEFTIAAWNESAKARRPRRRRKKRKPSAK
ncbi:MAG: hypothetical protein N2C14_33975, partial [Planctomycetales bacterium]